MVKFSEQIAVKNSKEGGKNVNQEYIVTFFEKVPVQTMGHFSPENDASS